MAEQIKCDGPDCGVAVNTGVFGATSTWIRVRTAFFFHKEKHFHSYFCLAEWAVQEQLKRWKNEKERHAKSTSG